MAKPVFISPPAYPTPTIFNWETLLYKGLSTPEASGWQQCGRQHTHKGGAGPLPSVRASLVKRGSSSVKPRPAPTPCPERLLAAPLWQLPSVPCEEVLRCGRPPRRSSPASLAGRSSSCRRGADAAPWAAGRGGHRTAGATEFSFPIICSLTQLFAHLFREKKCTSS